MLAFLLCWMVQPAVAQLGVQDTTALYRIQTLDGNEYIGTILQENEEFLQLRTKNLGDITIAKKDIKRIQPIHAKQVVGGQLWLDNPQATRYFWSPNGYGLRKGEGYYQNVWIFFNQASIGLSDRFSLGVGTIPLFLIAGTSSPFWLTPKVSIPVSEDKFQLGAGALLGTVIGIEGSGFGIVYGIGTLGSRNQNASIGLGYAFAGDEWTNAPVVTLSGMLRIGKNGYLLTENYIIPADGEAFALLLFGGRSIIRKVGLDYGLVFPSNTGNGVFFAIPWLGVTVPFGKTPTNRQP